MNYEFQTPLMGILGLIGLLFWQIDFFHLWRRPDVHIPANLKKTRPFVKRFIIWVAGTVGWLYLSFALMVPRLPMGVGKNTIEVNDVFVVMDLSRSMLAEDFKPNRFEAAKDQVHKFVDLLPRERIGIVIFAERVFTLLPLSTDLKLIQKMVDQIELGPLGDGTNIGDALALAVGRLTMSQAKSKAIILLTDGVSNVGSMTPLQAAEIAKEKGVKIYTIGIGGDKDALIPTGRNFFGQQGYQRIPGGSVDFKNLQEIAQLTNGKAYLAKSEGSLEKVLKEIGSLEKTKIEASGKIIYNELYYKYLLIGALLFLFSELYRRFGLKEIL